MRQPWLPLSPFCRGHKPRLSLAGVAKGRALPTEPAAAEATAGQKDDLGSINPNTQKLFSKIISEIV
ncbi:hypothetical protein L484_017651 [Morus notabilis]|uniref:Uncharacterized protein n=1 Tax=Morus notabilis TaxID=981085 RepID=W9S8J8_9ROSA|nr:hypothetical protein L484_017651 [Morus notabilis]